MNKRKLFRTVVELGKDILILLLTLSAVWLLFRSPMVSVLDGLLTEEEPQISMGQIQTEARAEAARPLRMTAMLPGGGQAARYGVQYDEAACDALFQQVAGLLREVLSSAGQPEQISRSRWETALSVAPSVCFDFQGELPLSVLAGWLSGEPGELTAPVRRVALSLWESSIALYYRDETTGSYYRCRSEVADPVRLEDALAGLSGNGIYYAFESDQYRMLDPDTMLGTRVSEFDLYSVTNPVTGGRDELEQLADELKFSINANGVYYAGEWVARSDNDTLRLSDGGTADYMAGSRESIHFLVAGDTLFDRVETCRQLAVTALGARSGQARLYLLSAKETEAGTDIRFGYSINGIPVLMKEEYAARFLVANGRVIDFTLHFRSYDDAGVDGSVLPAVQAAAALEAMGLTGEELALVYLEQEDERVAAGWVAAGHSTGER